MTDDQVQSVVDYLGALYWSLPYDEWAREGSRVVSEATERAISEARRSDSGG